MPLLTSTGFNTLAWILTGFLVVSGVIGWLWTPRNEGKSLEQLDAAREHSSMALQFRRYKGAQIFAFDKGRSLRAATATHVIASGDRGGSAEGPHLSRNEE